MQTWKHHIEIVYPVQLVLRISKPKNKTKSKSKLRFGLLELK